MQLSLPLGLHLCDFSTAHIIISEASPKLIIAVASPQTVHYLCGFTTSYYHHTISVASPQSIISVDLLLLVIIVASLQFNISVSSPQPIISEGLPLPKFLCPHRYINFPGFSSITSLIKIASILHSSDHRISITSSETNFECGYPRVSVFQKTHCLSTTYNAIKSLIFGRYYHSISPAHP